MPTANSSPETSEPSQGRRRWPVRGTARAGHPATRHEANVSRVPWGVASHCPAADAGRPREGGGEAWPLRSGRTQGEARRGAEGAGCALSLLARPQRPPRSRPPSSRTVTAVTVRRKEPAHGSVIGSRVWQATGAGEFGVFGNAIQLSRRTARID